MKKTVCCLLMVLTLGLTGCRYEEGPGISFRTPQTRIQGYWLLERVYKNGQQIFETEDLANQIANFYSFFYDGYLAVTAIQNGTTRESPTGKWMFQNGEKELLIDFVLVNKHYNYVARVTKLSYQELRYEYTDENGDTWRLVMFKQLYW